MGKRIIARRRGRGGSTYRSPSHRHPGEARYPRIPEGKGKVTDLVHAPGRSAPLMRIDYGVGKALMIAPEGLSVGQEVVLGRYAPIEMGNTLPIGLIPEGTIVHNIESVPGDGGKLVRAAGAGAAIVSHGRMVVIQLPSGKFRRTNPSCRATIGIVAGSGRREKPFTKAGKKYHAHRSKAKRYFQVKGIAMNPVNHPHGGGGHPHVGKPSTVSANAPPGRKVGRLSPKKRRR
ncbi:MAG: 50S ribosomal protein L2 [Candidatus Thermoplasmatota archaeon]